MPTQTDNLDLVLPDVGASRNTWGTLLNGNFTALDTVMPIGTVLDYAGPTAPVGWLLCNGAAVSRTTYSNLFAILSTAWGAGDGSTTFNLPDTRGRGAVGAGSVTDSGGTTTVYALGQKTGAVRQSILQTHLPNVSLTSNSTGAHTHGGTALSAGTHSHTGNTDDDGTGDHNHGYFDPQSQQPPTTLQVAPGTYVIGGGDVTSTNGRHVHHFFTENGGAHTHTIATDSQGNHTHSVSLGGGGTSLPTVPPVIAFNKIIYAGPPP